MAQAWQHSFIDDNEVSVYPPVRWHVLLSPDECCTVSQLTHVRHSAICTGQWHLRWFVGVSGGFTFHAAVVIFAWKVQRLH